MKGKALSSSTVAPKSYPILSYPILSYPILCKLEQQGGSSSAEQHQSTSTAPSPVPGWLCPCFLGSTSQRSVPKAQEGPAWPAGPQPPPPSFCCKISSKGQGCFSLSLLNAALPACRLLSTAYSSRRKPQSEDAESSAVRPGSSGCGSRQGRSTRSALGRLLRAAGGQGLQLPLQPLPSKSPSAGDAPGALTAGASVKSFQRPVWSWGIAGGVKPVRARLRSMLSPLWEPYPA
ncbi:uncharacterized protein LOC128820680 [Vidua macroura]|uniref:uncharacterized protein LOC128820680 n=1 Tax=Vidua macroura TaxID=187451 RepID=UPI0023A8779E|nr:uncharacterized protein LOC128820680 [Vidua macroura]